MAVASPWPDHLHQKIAAGRYPNYHIIEDLLRVLGAGVIGRDHHAVS